MSLLRPPYFGITLKGPLLNLLGMGRRKVLAQVSTPCSRSLVGHMSPYVIRLLVTLRPRTRHDIFVPPLDSMVHGPTSSESRNLLSQKPSRGHLIVRSDASLLSLSCSNMARTLPSYRVPPRPLGIRTGCLHLLALNPSSSKARCWTLVGSSSAMWTVGLSRRSRHQ
jgi:hypothetical protein